MRFGSSLGVQASAPFSPVELFIGGLQGAYYDCYRPETLFQDAAATVPAVVDVEVACALDLSGNARHATQATLANRPFLRLDATSGRYYLDFNGTTQFLSVAWSLSAYPLSLGAAARAAADPATLGGVVSVWQTDASYKALSKAIAANGWSARDRNSTAINAIKGNGTNATPHTLLADFRTATVDVYVDQTTSGAANTNAFGAVTTLYLGKLHNGGQFFPGRIYAAQAIATTLTSEERGKLHAYNAQAAGI